MPLTIERHIAGHQPLAGDNIGIARPKRIMRLEKIAGGELAAARVNQAGPPAHDAAVDIDRQNQPELRLLWLNN